MKTHTLILLAALTLTGCFESKFDREKAEAILNKKLSQPSISTLGFSDSGFKKAEQNKLIIEVGFFNNYKITDKGMAVFGTLATQEQLISCGIMSDNAAGLTLKLKLAEKVTSIDGIANAGNGRKLVEFTTGYLFPASTPPEITQYLYSGRQAKAVFALYDDGWRILEE
ncbi:MAG: hypothetical protein WCS31_06005 [Verrucomicrobiae bacterium]